VTFTTKVFAAASIVFLTMIAIEANPTIVSAKPLDVLPEPSITVQTKGEAIAVSWSSGGNHFAAVSAYGETISVWRAGGELVSQIDRAPTGPILLTRRTNT
jgi:hypothetical protein